MHLPKSKTIGSSIYNRLFIILREGLTCLTYEMEKIFQTYFKEVYSSKRQINIRHFTQKLSKIREIYKKLEMNVFQEY